MKIKFRFCCHEEIFSYVEQTPDEVIKKDYEKWVDKIINGLYCGWEYCVD